VVVVEVGPSHPVRVDLRVGSILVEIVVEEQPSRANPADHEIEVAGMTVRERNGQFIPDAKEIEDVSDDVEGKIGPPERPVSSGILDQGTRVANEGRIDLELLGDREGPPVTSSGAEDRPDPGPDRPMDGFDRPGSQATFTVE
jgi:hypothetical protein